MRILVLAHESLIPPETVDLLADDFAYSPWITEYHVISNLKKMRHQVQTLGIYSDLKPIREAIEDFKPHIVYNLLEEFAGQSIYDQNVVSYLELLAIPYTGCHPRGLMLARDKALAKKILTYHRIKTPKFCVFPKNKKVQAPQHLSYPLIVKCLHEEASYGISQASLVQDAPALYERVDYINQKLKVDAIAEQFIPGREFYVGILGNYRLKTLPVWELFFANTKNPQNEFYSRSAKFNKNYRGRHGIGTGVAEIHQEQQKKIFDICKRSYRALNLNGYARIDLRMDEAGSIYVLEVNPNPDISATDDFALSAEYAKIPYRDLLKKILNLGLSWSKTY